MLNISIADRIVGCLLAGAVGDAIGAHFEGAVNPDFEIPKDLRVTDDTQLTLATCEAIIEYGSVDPDSIASQFLQWYRERRITGIGSSTLKALRELDVGGHWAMVGASGEHSAGNGAAMRAAPLAFVLDPNDRGERQTIRDVCRITHRNDEAYIGALAMIRSIRHVMTGYTFDDSLLSSLVDDLPDSRVRDRLTNVLESSLSVTAYAERFKPSGYVVDSVPMALLAAVRSSDLLSTIEQIVKCGGDTDTIASMFGQLYGACYGSANLPDSIIDLIDAAPLVRQVASDLARTLSG